MHPLVGPAWLSPDQGVNSLWISSIWAARHLTATSLRLHLPDLRPKPVCQADQPMNSTSRWCDCRPYLFFPKFGRKIHSIPNGSHLRIMSVRQSDFRHPGCDLRRSIRVRRSKKFTISNLPLRLQWPTFLSSTFRRVTTGSTLQWKRQPSTAMGGRLHHIRNTHLLVLVRLASCHTKGTDGALRHKAQDGAQTASTKKETDD
ncbi:hypothetical protein B0H66DRAFT_94370 [Apodospora peruviana]|uniref:Uncharacterized protein n=1 Tax=Apodospora peruviana TaxID=516989 RepID=A0AAE0IUP2_9PEZI|nr:hypothetical protein B0H66DRAFT_94370 [Apodospora peruviana]